MAFLGVLQLNVYAKRFIEHFTGFSLSTPPSGRGLFDADDLIAVRALAEAMTGAIHFVLWPQPARTGQFWFFHAPSVPQARRLGYPCGYSTDPLPVARSLAAFFFFRSALSLASAARLSLSKPDIVQG